MEADRRRVLLFIAAGLLVATLIGVTVWYAGSPTENRDQQTSGAASVATSTAHAEKPTAFSETESAAPQEGHGELPESDPYLPPNAVIAAPSGQPSPTVVYRPSNIVPLSGSEPETTETESASAEPEIPETTEVAPPEEPADTAMNAPATPTEAAPTAETTAEATPTTPAEPTGAVTADEAPLETAVPTEQPTTELETAAPPVATTTPAETQPAETLEATPTTTLQQEGPEPGSQEPPATSWWDHFRNFFR